MEKMRKLSYSLRSVAKTTTQLESRHPFRRLPTLTFLAVVSSLCFRLALAQESETILDTSTIRPVVVNLPEFGRVQGKRQSGIDFFGGLPYAAPPVGNRRWAPPEPPAPWAPAKLDATQFASDCWQLVDPLVNPGAEEDNMSEDCLYLNIYTPAGQAARYKLMPVMVWLHGGAFQQGGGGRAEYDGTRLAERGTVVVTLNYRLGALGFLVSSPDGLFGNFGLMDQRAALRWVKENIKFFGGDPDNVTLFGESAGAVMTGLHLMMEGAGTLFHKAVIQSNPLGLQFRSVVVADFIGEALKHAVDCRDLACLRSERVEEIMRAQSSLMGVPRSVGDFFTWGPTLTQELKLTLAAQKKSGQTSPISREHNNMFRDLDSWKWQSGRDIAWAAVNVSQPLRNFADIPDDIPIIIGANKNEGEMFVHSAFPITMSKAVYWMFVGALFRDSASRVLRHYRGYVDQIEKEAADLALKQVEEEENRQYYLEHKEELDKEYHRLSILNSTKSGVSKKGAGSAGVDAVFETWTRGGALADDESNETLIRNEPWHQKLIHFGLHDTYEERIDRLKRREQRRKLKAKERALKEAAKVVVDYRPVMSRIIDDYLFRCPSWHLANSISRNRQQRRKKTRVYVYQFSHSTHIPGYKECWGKSCHTSELPYVFQAMDIIRTNYSTLGPYAQAEAPITPEYPYTDILAAYREAAAEAAGKHDEDDVEDWHVGSLNVSHSIGFQKILQKFFGDYFKVDADEETASDMADRWVAFAKTGDPNYDGSRNEWRPWRHNFDENRNLDYARTWQPEEFDQIFEREDDDDHNVTAIEGYLWSEDPQERAFRRRALRALGMEVVEEDVFRTLLKRTPKSTDDNENPFQFLLGKAQGKKTKGGAEERLTRNAIRQLQQIAQDMNLLGKGLAGEPRRGSESWTDDFFPEMLDIKWPPEGRLVERDCTCDMWDRIRYRY